MRKFIVGCVAGLLIGGVAQAGIDAHHPGHEKAERMVCERPRHMERAHGLTIMPEACDR